VVEATYDLAGNGKARILGTAGAVKVLASKDGPVIGVHMVGERVGELIAEAQLITNWEALPGEVAQLIHPHPTCRRPSARPTWPSRASRSTATPDPARQPLPHP
jgi:pyruvate/2-oxoglutarate dehydrogenase complex dihydrolipoamide dehydrogenase (E3) component